MATFKPLFCRIKYLRAVLITLFISMFTVGPVLAVEITSHEQAEKLIAKISKKIDRNRGDATLFVQRGGIYFKLRDFDSAVEDYTRAIKINDKLDQAWFGRGMAQGRLGYIDEGIADLSVFIKRNPNSSLAYTKRGVRYLWKGDRENAHKDLTRAVELDPNNAEAHDDLGVVLAQTGKYNEAIAHFRLTVRLDPTYQKGHHNLAMALYVVEKDELALARVNIAQKLDPEARNTLLLKSEILNAMGRVAEAGKLEDEAMFLQEGNWSERAPIE